MVSLLGEGISMAVWGMRVGCVAVIPLLAGCASLPASVQIASLAATGVSYLATGRGPSDHLVSAIIEKDCALLRIVRNRPICIDPQPASSPLRAPRVRVAAAEREGMVPARLQARSEIRSVPTHVYLVIGSFRDQGNAQRWQTRNAAMRAAVASARDERGSQYYRVVVGPLRDEGEVTAAWRRLSTSGQSDLWTVQLCANDLTGPPCHSPPATVAAR
ncbi:MAG: SPOR domain-containing protein [Chromatiales bacterium]